MTITEAAGRLKYLLNSSHMRVIAWQSRPLPGKEPSVSERKGSEGRLSTTIEERAADLVRRGLARPPRRRLDAAFLELERPLDPEGRSLEAVLEER